MHENRVAGRHRDIVPQYGVDRARTSVQYWHVDEALARNIADDLASLRAAR
jgi:hypothetical protein